MSERAFAAVSFPGIWIEFVAMQEYGIGGGFRIVFVEDGDQDFATDTATGFSIWSEEQDLSCESAGIVSVGILSLSGFPESDDAADVLFNPGTSDQATGIPNDLSGSLQERSR